MRATRFVDCPFSAVIEFAEEALRERPDVTLSPAPRLARHVCVASQVCEDVSDPVRRHDALLLAWRPPSPLFPDFHGAFTVRPKGRGAWLRVQGSYEPPFGALGRAFDSLFGRRIARRTLEHLLRDISESAEHRWRSFREELPV